MKGRWERINLVAISTIFVCLNRWLRAIQCPVLLSSDLILMSNSEFIQMKWDEMSNPVTIKWWFVVQSPNDSITTQLSNSNSEIIHIVAVFTVHSISRLHRRLVPPFIFLPCPNFHSRFIRPYQWFPHISLLIRRLVSLSLCRFLPLFIICRGSLPLIDSQSRIGQSADS